MAGQPPRFLLRVCSWNIQLGLHLEQVLGTVKNAADFRKLTILALQETSSHAGRADAALVAEALGPSYAWYQVTAQELRGREQANALVWDEKQVQITSKTRLELPLEGEATSMGESVLLRWFKPQHRGAVMIEGTFAKQVIRAYSLHLDMLGFAHKALQLRHVLKDASSRPSADLTLLAGDLNTFSFRSRPSWRGLRELIARQDVIDVTRDLPWTHSLRRLRLHQKLDAVLATSPHPFRHQSWALEAATGSDHIPIFADLEW